MKINHIKSQSRFNFSKKNNVFLNLYYFFSLYRYLFLWLIGLALSASIILVTIDLLSPSLLKNIDKKTTLELFDQLQKAKRHQDAIVLMEYKAGFLNDSPLSYEYKSKLSDSYIWVGDYSKAEKLLLDLWKNLPDLMKTERNKSNGLLITDEMVASIRFGFGRQLYQLYEKMGDVQNQLKFFHIFKKEYDKASAFIDSMTVNIINDRQWLDLSSLHHKELVEYDSIAISYYSNEEKAIQGMDKYINKILHMDGFRRSYKVKCLNKLIGWQLDHGYLSNAYTRISQALEIVKDMQIISEYSELGLLSDYCYQIHDIELSKDLFERYNRYINSEYNSTDLEYVTNYVRKLRYLENENKLDELKNSLIKYCVGMKNQITLNMPSMSSEQREYLAQSFNVAYDYAFSILKSYPSNDLANLCFENFVFKTGLLLRSNITLKNNISNLNNPKATQLYSELDSCRRELIYQSISGKKIFTSSKRLKSHIEELEKDLALLSTDFRLKNDFVLANYKEIQNKLHKGEVMLELIQHEDDLLALVLRESGDVEYYPITTIEAIKTDLQQPIFNLYHDAVFTDKILGKVKDIVKDHKSIYYVPNGIFSQLALGTLYMGNGTYLYDLADIHLLSNPVMLLADNTFKLDEKSRNISLWGGISYGGKANSSITSNRRSAFTRGEHLNDLRYSLREVNDIADMLSQKSYPINLYRDSDATETSFKERNNKQDFILHISTHGFFDDKSEQSKSMYNSGLFFAGANKYWTNDSLKLGIGEDDGILRAVEISTMNLSKCGLVVLSACETGLGFSQSSEGVYGLQRAFKLAGVDYILMSLWDVDDRATSLLMTEFYKLLLLGEDAEKALRNSKDFVRSFNPSPKDWGAFVLLH